MVYVHTQFKETARGVTQNKAETRRGARMAALLPAPCPSRPVLTTAACGLLALVLVLATRPSHPTAALTTAGAAAAAVDAIVVLAGGVDETGVPHESVLRRLRAAARHHHASSASGLALPILLNGGGTTHTPKWVDREGYAVPEAALMGRYLCTRPISPICQSPFFPYLTFEFFF